jgi:hypothetical protein
MCDYSNAAAALRKEWLEDMIKIAEEAGLYEDEPTLDEAVDAVKRVRQIHKKMKHSYGKIACTECGQTWPCQTTRALDGELQG